MKDFVRALAGVIDEVDPYTRKHSIRVATYAVAIARDMGLSERQIEDIECGALFHDIGKVGADRAGILVKPARLTPEEKERMSEHVRAGVEIVGKIRALERAAEIVGTHHERLDGSGYPDGLRGAAIDDRVRVLAVADTYDAMSGDRAYRKGMSKERIVEELTKCSGTKMDDRICQVFIDMIRSGEIERYSRVQPGRDD